MPDSKRDALFPISPQTLVGGAPVATETLTTALKLAPRLVAADGGADTVLRAGLFPERVIGDMDSISAQARAAFADRLHPIEEQDSTDFCKALRTSPASLTIAVGFIGARVDHFLACLSVLARTKAPCVLLGEVDCICLLPPTLALDLKAGTRVSLWPLGGVRGRSTGLQWPIDGIDFDPAGRVGTSNAATGRVELTVEGPMALILPADCLPQLVTSMQRTPREAPTPGL